MARKSGKSRQPSRDKEQAEAKRAHRRGVFAAIGQRGVSCFGQNGRTALWKDRVGRGKPFALVLELLLIIR
jgi:hypothetical protein